MKYFFIGITLAIFWLIWTVTFVYTLKTWEKVDRIERFLFSDELEKSYVEN